MKRTKGHLVKRGRVYWAQWKSGGTRHRVSTGESDKRKAQVKLRELVEPFTLRQKAETLAALASKVDATQTALERIEDERNPPPALVNLWQAYLDAPNRPDTGAATLRQYKCQFERFVAWVSEQHKQVVTIRDVTPAVAEGFMAHLAKTGVSANTFNKYLALLRLVWRIMMARGKAQMDPWTQLSRRQLVTVSKRELTIEELRTVCRSAEGEMQALFAIGLFSGLRLGDAATLRWSEVDLDRGIILRVANKTSRRNPKPVTVPLVPELRTMLVRLKQTNPGPYVVPRIARLAREDYRALIHSIQEHFASCGIKTDGEKGADRQRKPVLVGFHSLRHSFVSICRMAGVSLAVVESVVGHSNPAMTRHYTHVGIEAATRAVQALPQVMTDAPAGTDDPDVGALLTKVRLMIESQQAKNWRDVKASVLALISTSVAKA